MAEATYDALVREVDRCQQAFLAALRMSSDEYLKKCLSDLVAARRAVDEQLENWMQDDDDAAA